MIKPVSPGSKSSARPQSGLKVYDILFVLFKHKWKILFLSFFGFSSAGALLFKAMRSPSYETHATLLVRYVLDRGTVDPYESRVDAGGIRGQSVMEAEVAIIKSADLALAVAEKIGPEKLVPESEKPPTRADAAIQIINNLTVTVTRGSNIIHLSYRNRNPKIAVTVLNELIETYFTKHLEIHRSTGAFDEVARQTDQARSRLSQTEAELNKLKTGSGVFSIADSKAALEVRRNEVRGNLLAAQVELAEQRVNVSSLETAMGVLNPVSPKEEAAEGKGPEHAEDGTVDRMASIRARDEYRDLAEQMRLFKQKRNELMMTRKPGDRMIVALDRQIDAIQQQGLDLIEKHPELASQTQTERPGGVSAPLAPAGPNLNVERARLAALDERLKALVEQAKEVDSEVEKLTAIGVEFTNLERRRQLEEEKYRYFETSLEKARVDEALNPSSMPNINMVQKPSMPLIAIDPVTKKVAIGLAVSGLLTGLGLAFLIEWVIDRRVSRPIEIQTRLQLPLMMSIPRIRSKDGIAKLIGRVPGRELMGDAYNLILPPEPPNGKELSLRNKNSEHFIMPYAGAMRDRIMFNFELNNITHKPKLVALTSLSSGAGTSTIAAGIAKAFAENGKHKVLLVDLNPSLRGSDKPQHPAESLGTVLDVSNAERFRQSSKSLYFASAPTCRDGKGANALASYELYELMPQLEACNFDYIVFDMPPVGPTSPTLAMAGFMDKVLLVLDAENTNRENLIWGYAELQKGRADVSCVFNKMKSHAPRWVEGDL